MTPAGGFIGKQVLQRDVEGALRSYMTEPFAVDPPDARAFKRFAARHWRDWPALFDRAPSPSNFRSVLTFLKDHPDDYRRALNLIPQRLLSIPPQGAGNLKGCWETPSWFLRLPVAVHLGETGQRLLTAEQEASIMTGGNETNRVLRRCLDGEDIGVAYGDSSRPGNQHQSA